MSLATRPDTEILLPLASHLVVALDDELQVLSSLQRLLRQEPYEFRSTSRPELVLEWAEAGGISLLLCDQRMPGVTGLELVDTLRRISPSTTVVMLTGYLDRIPLEAPVRERVEKPWDDRELRRTIRLLLREKELKASSGDSAA